MNALVLNPIHQEQSFGLLIVLYFFLAGLSAGFLMLSTAWTVFGWQAVRPLARPAAMAALATFIPAPLVLIADLASPLKFYQLMFNFNPTSVMAWGTWIITFYGLILVWYTWKMWKNESVSRGLALSAVGLSIALAGYTGLLLGVVPGRPLWNSAIVPALFLLSAIVCAVALLTILAILLPAGKKTELSQACAAIKKLKPALMSAEALLIGFHLIVLALASVAARETVSHLLSGPRQFSFVGLQLILGLLVPGILLALPQKSDKMLALAGVLSVIGVFMLRLNFVFAGQEVAMVVGSVPVMEVPSWHVAVAVVTICAVFYSTYRCLASDQTPLGLTTGEPKHISTGA